MNENNVSSPPPMSDMAPPPIPPLTPTTLVDGMEDKEEEHAVTESVSAEDTLKNDNDSKEIRCEDVFEENIESDLNKESRSSKMTDTNDDIAESMDEHDITNFAQHWDPSIMLSQQSHNHNNSIEDDEELEDEPFTRVNVPSEEHQVETLRRRNCCLSARATGIACLVSFTATAAIGLVLPDNHVPLLLLACLSIVLVSAMLFQSLYAHVLVTLVDQYPSAERNDRGDLTEPLVLSASDSV